MLMTILQAAAFLPLITTRNDTTTTAAASATTIGLVEFIGRGILPPIVALPLLLLFLMGVVPLLSIIHPGVVECLPLIAVTTALAISMQLLRLIPIIVVLLRAIIMIPALISIVLSVSLLISYILVLTLTLLLVLVLLLLPVIALCRVVRAHHIVRWQRSGVDNSTTLLGTLTAVAGIAFQFHQPLHTRSKDPFRFPQQA